MSLVLLAAVSMLIQAQRTLEGWVCMILVGSMRNAGTCAALSVGRCLRANGWWPVGLLV